LPVRQFSKLVVSATHPNFLTYCFSGCKYKKEFLIIKTISLIFSPHSTISINDSLIFRLLGQKK